MARARFTPGPALAGARPLAIALLVVAVVVGLCALLQWTFAVG